MPVDYSVFTDKRRNTFHAPILGMNRSKVKPDPKPGADICVAALPKRLFISPLDIADENPKNAGMDKTDVLESSIGIEKIKRQLGPCGIVCGKCYAFANGAIRHHSSELLKALGNFEPYAKRFVALLEEPVFGRYPDFKEMLAHFANGGCKGCRNDDCQLFKGCRVKECARDKAVDFCFQCPEFPCDHTGFDENLQKRWIAINRRMKKIGVERYFAAIKDISRY